MQSSNTTYFGFALFFCFVLFLLQLRNSGRLSSKRRETSNTVKYLKGFPIETAAALY